MTQNLSSRCLSVIFTMYFVQSPFRVAAHLRWPWNGCPGWIGKTAPRSILSFYTQQWYSF